MTQTTVAEEIDYQHARIYFWNPSMGVSPAITGEYPTKKALSSLIWDVLVTGASEFPGMSHEHWAAFYCHKAWETGFMIEIGNAPAGGGDRIGGLVSRIQSADQVVGGYGTLMIDPIGDLLEVYGGGGLDLMAPGTYVPTLVRTYRLQESLEAVLDPPKVKKGKK